jgi:hypothetical protein
MIRSLARITRTFCRVPADGERGRGRGGGGGGGVAGGFNAICSLCLNCRDSINNSSATHTCTSHSACNAVTSTSPCAVFIVVVIIIIVIVNVVVVVVVVVVREGNIAV